MTIVCSLPAPLAYAAAATAATTTADGLAYRVIQAQAQEGANRHISGTPCAKQLLRRQVATHSTLAEGAYQGSWGCHRRLFLLLLLLLLLGLCVAAFVVAAADTSLHRIALRVLPRFGVEDLPLVLKLLRLKAGKMALQCRPSGTELVLGTAMQSCVVLSQA
jgi:hypothetical protein